MYTTKKKGVNKEERLSTQLGVKLVQSLILSANNKQDGGWETYNPVGTKHTTKFSYN